VSNPAHRASDDDRRRRLTIAIVLNLVIVVVQAVTGIIAGSLGLIADAGHNLVDVGAVTLSLLAIRYAQRRATERRSFGNHRATVLAAQFNAVAILAVTAVIAFEAVQRLGDPAPVDGLVVVIVALVAALVNGATILVLRHGEGLHGGHGGHEDHEDPEDPEDSSPAGGARERDLNMRSAMLHMAGDAAASVGIAASGAAILVLDGSYWLDPAASLVVAALIAVQGWHLVRATSEMLLEATPAGIDLETLTGAMAGVDGVDHIHDLHVWSLNSDIRALSAHVVVQGHPTLEEAQTVAQRVRLTVASGFGIAHATLELECESCSDDGPWCAIDPAVASTVDCH
jgi:cobalt-zinc-cadmium efflux system protein